VVIFLADFLSRQSTVDSPQTTLKQRLSVFARENIAHGQHGLEGLSLTIYVKPIVSILLCGNILVKQRLSVFAREKIAHRQHGFCGPDSYYSNLKELL
jgi:hypothetical protein